MLWKIIVLFAIVFLAQASRVPVSRSSFVAWMQEHGKAYEASEFADRLAVWQANAKFINEFEGEHEVAMNQFGDLSPEEFRRLYTGRVTHTAGADGEGVETVGLPASVDWRSKGVVTGVKNQGQCGSCWSFSTTGSTEGAHAIKTGNLVSLSEQQLVDCSGSYGNQGCNGGLMDNAFRYIIAVGGLETESDYPYTAAGGTCQFDKSKVAATLSSYQDVDHTESALQQAVATVGPISVAIDAAQSSFQFYSGGVYYSAGCSPTALDHGVLVVGYGTDNGADYWLVKNSWGPSWGLSGYIQMARNRDNNCGIASMPSYPIA